MADEEPKSKAEDKAEDKERPKPPPGMRKLRKLLKRVINAPPMRNMR
jgi:hypothetical protein